jgi:RNA polymerase sigma factor (sigma-70 family)
MMLAAHDRGLGEQIGQEAFTRLYERWPSIESEDHALRFVYRTALNLATSHHRGERRWRSLASSRGAELAGRDVAGPEHATAQRDELFAALRRLSPKQRACVVLVDYVGFDDRDAASTLGIAASTVRVHLTRGRRALRAALTSEESEP